MNTWITRCVRMVLLCAAALAGAALAQNVGSVKGVVSDPSGASVPAAHVTLTGGREFTKTAETSALGAYEFGAVPAGKYKLRITATGFTPFEVRNLTLEAGKPVTLKSELVIATETQSVTVADYSEVSVETSSVAGAIVLKGADLDVLSDDPDDLASDLQALAGPSAGPNGGEIFVDGFSGGKLPPKSSIREVRINQDPFSAEYDRMGFGRIEILTKPGTDKLHGQGFFNFGNQDLNSRNPFAPTRAPYSMYQYGGNIGGSLGKKASWFFNAERRSIDENAVVSATVLDANLQPAPYSESIVTPIRRFDLSPRLDYQINQNNTLVGRYSYDETSSAEQGIGQFTLPSQATDTNSHGHTLQLTETAILNVHMVTETRFQYMHTRMMDTGDNSTPSLMVLQSFNSGGAPIGLTGNTDNRFEWTNITTLTKGRHVIKFGGRLRVDSQSDSSDSNFNGTFTFAGGLAPQLDSNGQVVNGPDGLPLVEQITSLERYRRTLYYQGLGYTPAQIRLIGGMPSQFTLTTGTPLADVSQTDVGLFAQDTWRIKPNLNVSYGLRWETQTNISDYSDFAPRFSVAYGLGKNPQQTKTVLRAGFGMFYDRIGDNMTLQANRFNGTTQVQYFVANPLFYPAIPTLDEIAAAKLNPTIRTLDPGMQTPYLMQGVLGVDRQLPKNTSLSVNYIVTRGVHMLRTRNINAPMADGTYPLGDIGNVYQYDASGYLRQQQLMINMRTQFNPRVMLFGFYVLGHANSDTDGAGSFPVNQYDASTEWGRAAYDVRNRFLMGGSIRVKYGIGLNPFIMASTGGPFNITTGKDNNLDTIFNDRPTVVPAGTTGPNIVTTSYGTFNLAPLLSDTTIIARNYGQGPYSFTVNLRVSKTWGFGEATTTATQRSAGGGPPMMGGGPPMGGGGGMRGGGGGGGGMRGGGMFDASSGRKYSLTFTASARNLLNHVNYGPVIGNLSSPQFGESNSLAGGFGPGGGAGAAGNRRIELGVRFAF